MKAVFLVLHFAASLYLFYELHRVQERQGVKAFAICCFFVFTVIPDFLIFDAYGFDFTWVIVLLFGYFVPAIILFQEDIISFRPADLVYIGFLIAILVYAVISRYSKGYIEDYYGDKLFGFIYTLLVPSVIIVLYKKAVFKNIEFWKRIVLIACVSYMMKNFALVGISSFRINYVNEFEALKNVIFASRVLGLGVILAIDQLRNKLNALTIIVIAFFLLQMLLFESRGPIVSVAVALLCYFVLPATYSEKKKDKVGLKSNKMMLSFFLFVILISGTILIYRFGYIDRLIQGFIGLRSGVKEGRSYIYEATIQAIKDSFPNGVGFGNTLTAIKPHISYYMENYPHNIILELLLEYGIAFALAALWLLLKGIRSYNHALKNGKNIRLLYCLFIYSLVNSMFSGDISGNNWLFYFGYLCVIESLSEDKSYKEIVHES